MAKSRSVLKKSQRPQSALELITTYSWAFLILALVLAVVFILIGTRPVSSYLASQCSIQPLLPCTQSIITTYNSIVPIKYTVLFINNVAPAMFFPSNSFVVTASGIGKSGTSSYNGVCSPQFALEYDEVVCSANIPGTLISSVGSSVNTDFNITYEICSNANQVQCPTSLYTSSGFSQQDVQPASAIFYQLRLSSNPNSIVVIDDQRYTTGQYVLLQSGNYVIYSIPPSGYIFASWGATPGASVLSSTSINTTATLSYNGILTVNFVKGGTTTTTVSGSACACGSTYVSCGGIQECTGGCPGSCPATQSICPFGQHSYICLTPTTTSTSTTSTSSTSTSSTSTSTTSTSSTSTSSTSTSSTSTSSTSTSSTSTSSTSTTTTTVVSTTIYYAGCDNYGSGGTSCTPSASGYTNFITFCTAADGSSPLNNVDNWAQNTITSSSWTSEGYNTSPTAPNPCWAQGNQYAAVAGVVLSNAPVYTSNSNSWLAASGEESLSYNVISSNSFVVIEVACEYACLYQPALPSGCGTLENTGVGFGTTVAQSYIGLCTSESSGSYTITATVNPDDYVSIAAYIFPP